MNASSWVFALVANVRVSSSEAIWKVELFSVSQPRPKSEFPQILAERFAFPGRDWHQISPPLSEADTDEADRHTPRQNIELNDAQYTKTAKFCPSKNKSARGSSGIFPTPRDAGTTQLSITRDCRAVGKKNKTKQNKHKPQRNSHTVSAFAGIKLRDKKH